MNATEDFSITQPTLQKDSSVTQDFPFDLLQDLKSHGSPDHGLETLNNLFASQDTSPDLLMSSADPFLDLVTSEDLPPDLFPSLLDSTFRPGDHLNEGSLTESDIM